MQYVGREFDPSMFSEENRIETKEFSPGLKCTHCDYDFNRYEFLISILLYGLILCQRNAEYLYGITCPLCQQTLIKKANKHEIDTLKRDLCFCPFGFSDITYLPNGLSYYATPLYFIKDKPEVQDLEIYFSNESQDWWNGKWQQDSFNEIMFLIIDENPELQNMYRTYAPGFGGIIGFYSSLFWFKENEIDKILQIENEKGLKILPRYFFKSEIIEKADQFAWNNQYYQDFLGIPESEIKISDQNGTSIPKETHFDLIDVLLNKHVDFEMSDNNDKNMFWFNDPMLSKKNPFYDMDHINPEQLQDDNVNGQKNKERLCNIYDEIEMAAGNDYVRRYISEHFQEYIDQYIGLIQRKDFTYVSIYNLNKKYLIEVYNIHRKEVLNTAKYAFYAEGPTWTITFDEETIRGLRGKGFEYLYHLVSNQNKSFSPEDVDALDGVNTESLTGNSKDGVVEPTYGSKGSAKVSKPSASHSDMISGDAVGNLKSEYQRLKAEKEKAEESSDPILIQDAEKKFDEFVEYYAEYFSVGGRVKKFKAENKVIKDRIAVNIKRALARIKKSSPNIWKHFDASLTPIYSSDLCYRPEKEIDWKCK